ncbi:hypothetical protein [Alteromonas flava]|uniref:hypothetical protein n=1 Tax=Alteromonas flava TaxID=2048003 RepID=UPI000C2866BD|nr:hypothetical protein [Alteromonas flava]
MEFTTFFDVTQSNLSYGFWFSVVIASIMFVLGVGSIAGKLSTSLFKTSRSFEIIWGIGATCLSGFILYFLISSVIDQKNEIPTENVAIISGKIESFRTIKRHSDLFEFRLDTGHTFRTNGLSKQVPRIGLPEGTIVKIWYSLRNNEILILQIEANQFAALKEQIKQFKDDCINYGKC